MTKEEILSEIKFVQQQITAQKQVVDKQPMLSYEYAKHYNALCFLVDQKVKLIQKLEIVR